LHAARTVEPTDRQGLERRCRYGLRAPLSASRLSVLPDGRVRYELAKPWPNPGGVTELIMEPVQFLKRLAALLPAPYQNSVRYHGVFANRSRQPPTRPALSQAPKAPLGALAPEKPRHRRARVSPPPPVAPSRSPSQPTLLPDDELDQTDPFDEEPSDAAAKLDRAVAAPRAPP
jgi:hypothetical protein